MALSVGMSSEWGKMEMERHLSVPDWQAGCLNTFNPLHSCSEKNFAVSHSLPKGIPPSPVNILYGSEGGIGLVTVWGRLVGFQVAWLINAMKTEPLMRHFLVVFHVIPHQGQTRSSNRRVHAVLRRLLCSYLRPGHRRSSQRQYHDQGNWTGTVMFNRH